MKLNWINWKERIAFAPEGEGGNAGTPSDNPGGGGDSTPPAAAANAASSGDPAKTGAGEGFDITKTSEAASAGTEAAGSNSPPGENQPNAGNDPQKTAEGSKSPLTDGLEENIAEWLKGKGFLNHDKPETEIIRSLYNLEKLKGAPADQLVKKLGADPSEEEIKAYRESMGVPLESNQYERHEGVPDDDPVMARLTEAAHKSNVSADQWAALQKEFFAITNEARDSDGQMMEAELQEWSKSDPQARQNVAALLTGAGVSKDDIGQMVIGSVGERTKALAKVLGVIAGKAVGEGQTPFTNNNSAQNTDFGASETAEQLTTKITEERARLDKNGELDHRDPAIRKKAAEVLQELYKRRARLQGE